MANIRQIAKQAKVSVSTVSRVLNHFPYVSETKRKAVQDAMDQLNYSRNINAVHLLRGKTNMIGVLLPYVNHPYFSSMMEGITAEALRHNYRLLLCQTDYQEHEETKALELLREKQIDGLIICSKTLSWDQIEPYSSFGPIVACESVQSDSISSVFLDHYAAFQFAIQYLIEHGHRQIGVCLSRYYSNSSETRRKALSDCLSSIGEPVRDEWTFYDCYGMEEGVEVVRRLMSLDQRPTALLVTGDQVAAGIIMEARQNGIRVPDDLAIIGFDNQPIAKILHITTVDNQMMEMGRRALSLLHTQITGEREKTEKVQLPFQLIPRSTVSNRNVSDEKQS
ncbi:LacI family DNA-binding transcriptional regulator [Brevibacillus sp. SYSU BS000544]|uniref:LacI family DNA-binding transcriptional regulator n=1 Tax=Brevibacillus sp. SYSU BS000544 TaxID=3416443 RepID=UPI003CE4DDAB